MTKYKINLHKLNSKIYNTQTVIYGAIKNVMFKVYIKFLAPKGH